MNEIWQNTRVAPDNTHHLINGKLLYSKRFTGVLKYHAPGIASVYDETGAYHIDLTGKELYKQRYLRTFGFYQNCAAVIAESGWLHIATDGSICYPAHYVWCGNFQESACAVCNAEQNYFHIDLSGKPLYKDRYQYVGDFKERIATVQIADGSYTHINFAGEKIHGHYFLDLDVFHKGFARAKDVGGWFHIDLAGRQLYTQRYAMVEPFYNGFARVEDEFGGLFIIDESGRVVRNLRQVVKTPLQQLSAELVGYWKTQTINTGIELGIFDALPANFSSLNKVTCLKPDPLKRLLRALAELKLIMLDSQDIWRTTATGALLQTSHPLSLFYAALHWAHEPYLAWMHLTEALQNEQPVYAKKLGNDLFDWLDQDKAQLERYQKAMLTYAKHDYADVAAKLDLSCYSSVIDAGGGQGVLLQNILAQNTHLKGLLLERPAVIKQLQNSAKQLSFTMLAFDLFQPWPAKAEIIFLTRVLHDWNDQQSIQILKYAKNALLPQGIIYVIEMLLDETNNNGGMLDLNMLLITGGKERTIANFKDLANKVGLKITKTQSLNSGNNIITLKCE